MTSPNQSASLEKLNTLITISFRPCLVIGRTENEANSFFPKIAFPSDVTPIYLAKHSMTQGIITQFDITGVDLDAFEFVKGIVPNELEFIWFDWSTFKCFANAKNNLTEYFSLLKTKLVSGGRIYLPFPESTTFLFDDSKVAVDGMEYNVLDFMSAFKRDSFDRAALKLAPHIFEFNLNGFSLPSYKALGNNIGLFNDYFKTTLLRIKELHTDYVINIFKTLETKGIFSGVTYCPDGKYVFVTEFGNFSETELRTLKNGYFILTV